MFMAELKTGLLTAAHDLSAVDLPLTADLGSGNEVYLRLDNTEQQLKKGDLYIKDQKGILSSVIYGPDKRTQVKSGTDQVLYTTYGPPGINMNQIKEQLELLETYLGLFAPQAVREELIIL
jgi:DNA/RNA-binding domain of Phe-tRNA-synthetase-like protein